MFEIYGSVSLKYWNWPCVWNPTNEKSIKPLNFYTELFFYVFAFVFFIFGFILSWNLGIYFLETPLQHAKVFFFTWSDFFFLRPPPPQLFTSIFFFLYLLVFITSCKAKQKQNKKVRKESVKEKQRIQRKMDYNLWWNCPILW